MNRYTFIVQVHPRGISTLENVTTHERIPLSELAEVGPLIERWLSELEKPEPVVTQPRQHS